MYKENIPSSQLFDESLPQLSSIDAKNFDLKAFSPGRNHSEGNSSRLTNLMNLSLSSQKQSSFTRGDQTPVGTKLYDSQQLPSLSFYLGAVEPTMAPQDIRYNLSSSPRTGQKFGSPFTKYFNNEKVGYTQSSSQIEVSLQTHLLSSSPQRQKASVDIDKAFLTSETEDPHDIYSSLLETGNLWSRHNSWRHKPSSSSKNYYEKYADPLNDITNKKIGRSSNVTRPTEEPPFQGSKSNNEKNGIVLSTKKNNKLSNANLQETKKESKAESRSMNQPSTRETRSKRKLIELVDLDPEKKRRLGPRSKKGCWTCRVRHKACPEDKPVCSQCLRLKLDCDYSETRPSYMTDPTSQTNKLHEIKRITSLQKKIKFSQKKSNNNVM